MPSCLDENIIMEGSTTQYTTHSAQPTRLGPVDTLPEADGRHKETQSKDIRQIHRQFNKDPPQTMMAEEKGGLGGYRGWHMNLRRFQRRKWVLTDPMVMHNRHSWQVSKDQRVAYNHTIMAEWSESFTALARD